MNKNQGKANFQFSPLFLKKKIPEFFQKIN